MNEQETKAITSRLAEALKAHVLQDTPNPTPAQQALLDAGAALVEGFFVNVARIADAMAKQADKTYPYTGP